MLSDGLCTSNLVIKKSKNNKTCEVLKYSIWYLKKTLDFQLCVFDISKSTRCFYQNDNLGDAL